MCMFERGHIGDGCELVSNSCKYDSSWAMVRRVWRGSVSSELLMCGVGVHSILLLSLVARCLEIIDVCIPSPLNENLVSAY